MEGTACRRAARLAPLALALALSIAAPSAALADDSASTAVTVVAAGFWPAQETATVDLDAPAGHFSKTSDAAGVGAMAALACMAASSALLIACVSRREDR